MSGLAIRVERCRLVVVQGLAAGQEAIFSADVVRVGKAPENDLVLCDETVSRAHLEIVRDGRGWLLRDLRSTNGTFLQGARVKEGYLVHGVEVGAGAARLRFEVVEQRIVLAPFEGERLGGMVGASQGMRVVLGLLAEVASTGLAVLIEGEGGSGRELAARTLHERSARQGGAFVALDCGAASTAELEVELFGRGRGGASRPCVWERARGGSVFLDGLDELSLELQARLASVLEARELRPTGSTRKLRIDARVLGGARRSLATEVEREKFRDDLLARLASVVVRLPPLRERRDDIPLLVTELLARAGGGERAPLPSALLELLVGHDWPGNVRELEQVVLRALAPGHTQLTAVEAAPAFATDLPFREQKERWSQAFERRYLVWLLAEARGNISLAARTAKMDRKYLHQLLREHGLSRVEAE